MCIRRMQKPILFIAVAPELHRHHDQYDDALYNRFPVRVHVQQVQRVADKIDDERPQHRADKRSPAARRLVPPIIAAAIASSS